MEVDESTLRRLIREEVWSAMNITERIMEFAGVPEFKGRHRFKPNDILDVVNKYSDGCFTKDVVADLGGGDRNFASNVSGHLVKLHKAGKILRFGERGGDGYLYKPISSHGG